MNRLVAIAVLSTLAALPACSGGGSSCGPSTGVVAEVIDGDTIVLDSGEKIRYLMVDTPEITHGLNECYGLEARDFNSSLVLGYKVRLEYDVQCTDAYDRLLAYVYVDNREVNSLLVERGYACVLYIPPNGKDRVDEFQTLEDLAKGRGTGMWGDCPEVPCVN